jgi:hypothetical protein
LYEMRDKLIPKMILLKYAPNEATVTAVTSTAMAK